MSDEPREVLPPGNLEGLLRKTLDRHGHGFQYAVLRRIRESGSPWRIEETEFPVKLRGETTHIDAILGWRTEFPFRYLLVAECKRANPALFDWCFVRTRRAGLNDEVLAEQVVVKTRANDIEGVSTGPRVLWRSQNVYQLGLPIRGGTKGDDSTQGDPRKEIKEACAQVWRGVNGLIELLARRPGPLDPVKYVSAEQRSLSTYILPAIFTTAKLWVSDVDLGDSEIATGRVPPTPLRALPWLWLEENISPALRHRLQGTPQFDKSFEDLLYKEYRRVVAIVGVDGIETFLKQEVWSAPG